MTEATPESRLVSLGLELPPPSSPIATYTMVARVGELLFTSGHGPWRDGELQYKGILGAGIDIPTGQKAAELVMLNVLASVKKELSELSAIRRVVKMLVLVASTPEFTLHHEVANGASDLLVDVLGHDAGVHTRSAVGVAALPMGISVEIEAIFAI
ncbi:MAG: hypothetical protein QOF68_1701 [Gaiellales bacterium]|jgi:enamine deaminase RidA (YjgF/YER057c/UK114 family)|nr:hypothetical protein [Gaiellales bacterium]